MPSYLSQEDIRVEGIRGLQVNLLLSTEIFYYLSVSLSCQHCQFCVFMEDFD